MIPLQRLHLDSSWETPPLTPPNDRHIAYEASQKVITPSSLTAKAAPGTTTRGHGR